MKYWRPNKMQVRKTFVSVWKNNYNVLSVSLYSLILLVVEEIMEMEFKCPREEWLKELLVCSYFLCPAVIILFLSLNSISAYIPWSFRTRKYSCIWKTEKIFKVLLPPLIWWVILLCDGRYVGCATSRNEGNNSQSKAAEFPSKWYIISQVRVLGIEGFRYFNITYFVCVKTLEYIALWKPFHLEIEPLSCSCDFCLICLLHLH